MVENGDIEKFLHCYNEYAKESQSLEVKCIKEGMGEGFTEITGAIEDFIKAKSEDFGDATVT